MCLTDKCQVLNQKPVSQGPTRSSLTPMQANLLAVTWISQRMESRRTDSQIPSVHQKGGGSVFLPKSGFDKFNNNAFNQTLSARVIDGNSIVLRFPVYQYRARGGVEHIGALMVIWA